MHSHLLISFAAAQPPVYTKQLYNIRLKQHDITTPFHRPSVRTCHQSLKFSNCIQCKTNYSISHQDNSPSNSLEQTRSSKL